MDEETKRLVTPPEHPRWSFKQRAVYWAVFVGLMAVVGALATGLGRAVETTLLRWMG